MTVQGMRDFVRNHLGTDNTELPDTLLDVYRQEGTDRITQSSQRWSFYEHQWTFTTTPDVGTYDFAAIQGVDDAVVGDLVTVQGPRWRLDQHAHEAMQEKFSWTTWRGEPRYWSQFASAVYLWPVPGATYAMKARGYRKPVAAVSATDMPDLPEEFHPLVAQWMLGRSLQQQDDSITAPSIFAQFEQDLRIVRARYESTPRGSTRTMGPRPRSPYARVGARLVFPWE